MHSIDFVRLDPDAGGQRQISPEVIPKAAIENVRRVASGFGVSTPTEFSLAASYTKAVDANHNSYDTFGERRPAVTGRALEDGTGEFVDTVCEGY